VHQKSPNTREQQFKEDNIQSKKMIQRSNGRECPGNEAGMRGHESKEGIMNAAEYDDVPEREVSALIADTAYDRDV